MLTYFETKKSQSNATTQPHNEFALAVEKYADQFYGMTQLADVNSVIQNHEAFTEMRDRRMTASLLWEGEKSKGKLPHIYTNPIVTCAVIEETIQSTTYGATFNRLSIQPSWITGKLVIVKEETHQDNQERKMVFLGRTVDINEAKRHLIPALLKDIALGATKVLALFPESVLADKTNLASYIDDNFESLFYQEKPALFHVEHSVVGEEDKPFENWKLVRLATSNASEQMAYDELRIKVDSPSIRLYMETLKRNPLIKNTIN